MEITKGQVFYNAKHTSYYSVEDVITDKKGNTWYKCFYPEFNKWATYSLEKIASEHKYISDSAGELLSTLYHTPA